MDKGDNCPPIKSGKSDEKDASHVLSNPAFLTERDVCSMYFKRTQNYQEMKSEFSSNLFFILYSPDISITNRPEGILFQFPSPKVLDRYLNRHCTSISNTLEKIKNLPQRFRIVKNEGLFKVHCYIGKKLDEYQHFVEKEGGTIINLNDPATIGFPRKISVFLLHQKFRVGVQIKHACILHLNCSICAGSGGWFNHTPPTLSTKSNPTAIINLQILHPVPNHSVSSTPSRADPTPSKPGFSPVKSSLQVEGPDSLDEEVPEKPPGVRQVPEKPHGVQEIVEKPPGVQKVPEKPPGVVSQVLKNEPAILTEKDLCSMIFRKSEFFTNEVRALCFNITKLIKLYPISIATNEDGIIFQFPSLETLRSVLNKVCIHGSTSLNQIRNLPQRLRFIKQGLFFKVMIYTTNIVDEISSYLQENGGVFVFDDKCQPRTVGFTEISSAFLFLQRFSHWNPKLQPSNIKEFISDSKPSKPISSYIKNLATPTSSSPHSQPGHSNVQDRTELTSQAAVPFGNIPGSDTTKPHAKPAQANIETMDMDSSEPSAQVDEPAILQEIHPKATGEFSTEEIDELRLVSVHNECVEIKSDFLFHPNSVCFLYPVEIDIREKNQQDIDLVLLSKFGPVTRISMTRNGFLRVWYSSRGNASSAVKQLKDKYPIQALRIEHVCYPQEQDKGKH